jgi:hypothetical protein
MLNYDGLTNAPADEVASATFRLLDTAQHMSPHIQAAATAAMFVLLTEHYRSNPQDVMQAVKNLLMRDREGLDRKPEFQAVRDYIRYEMGKK